MKARLTLAVVVVVAAAVRVPFWWYALHASVDGDTAIVGLMARHPTRGTTLWGQPYGSPLDGWLAAPFVAALGPTPAAVRIPYALLALALVAAAYVVAERVRSGAGVPAALLLACPPAYLLLLSALPPPLYPSTLVLLAAVVGLAAAPRALFASEDAPRGRLALLGGLAGLALWTHLMSLATLASVAAVLAWSAAQARRRGRLAWALVPFLLASAPWWTRALRDPTAVSLLGFEREGTPALVHADATARRLHQPVSALLGAWTPLTADEGERTVRPPAAFRIAIVLAWIVAAAAGLAALGAQPVAGMLAGAAALTVLAFPLPARSDWYTVRFLTPALLPLAVLAGAGAVRIGGRTRAPLLVLPLCAAQLWVGLGLLREWRRAAPDAIVPDCGPALDALARERVAHAYASYHTAWCLTYTSGESVVASPPWNERFYGYSMPFLDAVRADPHAAWVLVPGVDFELPAPRTFEAKLAGIGGRARRIEAGPARIYVDFVPPFGPQAAPGAIAGPTGDGDIATRVVEPATGPAVFPLTRPVATAGLTLLASQSDPGLPRAMDLEVSSDGSTFERIGRRRRGRETVDLAWIDGHPQFLVDTLAFSVPLDGRTIVAVRVSPTEAGPWAVAEVLIHPAGGAPAPWPATNEAFDAGALFRALLASRHR